MNTLIGEFLLTGQFGPLCIGAPAQGIVDLLGEAPSLGLVRKSTTAQVWKFGPVEMTVISDTVQGIKLCCFDPPNQLPQALGGFDLPGPETTLYEMIGLLNDIQANWTVFSKYTFDRQLCIRASSSVLALFDLDHLELQQLRVETLPGQWS